MKREVEGWKDEEEEEAEELLLATSSAFDLLHWTNVL